MPDPADVGQRVLEGARRGAQRSLEVRRPGIERRRTLIRRALDLDILGGHLPRGRPVRIARALRGEISERQVRRLLEEIGHGYAMSDSTK